MQVADPELAQVRQPRAYAGERAGEAVDVGDVAERLLALEPVRSDLALVVECAQLGRALGGGERDRVEQLAPRRREALVAAVKREQRVTQLGEEALQPGAERDVAGDPSERALVVGAHLRAHRVDVLHRASDT